MPVEAIPSNTAAKRLGVSAPTFHKLASEHGLQPVLVGEGSRGVRFWAVADIDRLLEERRAQLLEEIARLDAERDAS